MAARTKLLADSMAGPNLPLRITLATGPVRQVSLWNFRTVSDFLRIDRCLNHLGGH